MLPRWVLHFIVTFSQSYRAIVTPFVPILILGGFFKVDRETVAVFAQFGMPYWADFYQHLTFFFGFVPEFGLIFG